MLEAKNYKFLNLPTKYALSDYKQAIKDIVRKYSGIKNLVSIYSWGNISTPGISDIDIVFVFKSDTNTTLPFLKRSFYFLKAKTRDIASHPFMFIDEESFQNIRYVHPNADFKLLYGKGIEIKKISSTDYYYASISLLNDIITRHYPRDFTKQLVNRKFSVRDTLLRLNSLKYSIQTLEKLTKEKNKQWKNKLKLIERLRKNWFESKDFNLLIFLNEEAIKISMEITDIFRKFLLKNKLVKINSGDKLKYNGVKNKSLFVRRWDKEKGLEGMPKNIRNKQKFYSILPLELSAQLIEYSKYYGPISSYIKKNISEKIDYQLKHKNILKRRIRILNKQAELASKLKHSDFTAFFDFGYTQKESFSGYVFDLFKLIKNFVRG